MPVSVQRDAAALPANTAVCLGAFDGLHRGHQALIHRARRHAPRVGLVTFDPHPTAVLAPDHMPSLLHAAVQRERVASALGVDDLVLLPFDRAMSKMAPAAFVSAYLSEGLAPAAVVVGTDFHFGAGRAGTADTLRTLLEPRGIRVDVVDLLSAEGPDDDSSDGHGDDHKVSSSDIRHALQRGDVATAGALLGRWHAVAGAVVHGAKRGRELGFPTANLEPAGGTVPPKGIYATALTVWSPDAPDFGVLWPSVTSVGHNPTFTEAGAPLTVETYVLDRDLGERLYGLEVEVAFVQRIRDEQKFAGADALVAQMQRDADAARGVLTEAALAQTLTPATTTQGSARP